MKRQCEWNRGGEQSKIVCLSSTKLLSQVSYEERGNKLEAIRLFSLYLSLSHSALLPTLLSPQTHTHACQHDSSQHDLKTMCSLSAERKERELWGTDFCSFFSPPYFSVPSQADDCLQNERFDPWMRRAAHNTERHICMCGTSKFVVIFALSLWSYWLVCLPCR